MPEPATVTLAAPARRGWFGKLPTHGDFVRSGLPEDTVAAWDSWVRAGLAASREALGERWLAAFLEAPVWRFRLAPGLAGAAGLVGVVAPSVDRAGRYFPLMLGATMERPPEPSEALPWFDALAAAAAEAVVEDWPQARLAEVMEAAGEPPEAGVLHSGATFATEGAPRVAPALRRSAVLPPPAAFAALLDDGAG